MLILTRKCQEAVVIGNGIGVEQILKVIVLEVRGANVKLGFEASDAIPIHRAEVWERIVSQGTFAGLLPLADRS